MENCFELEIDKYEISVDIIMGQENTIAIYFRVSRLERERNGCLLWTQKDIIVNIQM